VELERNFEESCSYSYSKSKDLLEAKRKNQMGEIRK
jgi:hypothetical protein